MLQQLLSIWESFCRVQGPVLAIGSIIFSVLLIYFGPNFSVTFDQRALVNFYIVSLLVFVWNIMLIDLLIQAKRSKHSHFPKVLCAIDLHRGSAREGQTITLLVEKSAWFSFDSVVSIYHQELFDSSAGSIEKYIGLGKVLNIQEDGKIQVLIEHLEADHVGIWEALKNNQQTILRALRVKPGVRWELVER